MFAPARLTDLVSSIFHLQRTQVTGRRETKTETWHLRCWPGGSIPATQVRKSRSRCFVLLPDGRQSPPYDRWEIPLHLEPQMEAAQRNMSSALCLSIHARRELTR